MISVAGLMSDTITCFFTPFDPYLPIPLTGHHLSGILCTSKSKYQYTYPVQVFGTIVLVAAGHRSVTREQDMPFARFDKMPREKRERLLHVAAQEFATHGFEGASLNRILEEAQLGKSSAYYYFEDKA